MGKLCFLLSGIAVRGPAGGPGVLYLRRGGHAGIGKREEGGGGVNTVIAPRGAKPGCLL